MEGPRAPNPSEYNDLIRFLDDNLRRSTNWSLSDEYPTAINIENLHNFRIIKDQDAFVSHALIKPTLIRTRRGMLKVGCIGSVITTDSHRNQGLSKQVLLDCLDSAQQQGCDIAILWTNLFDFYRKMGFELAGSEVSLIIERPLPVRDSNFKFVESNRVDAHALFRVYSQHTVGSIRNIEDFDKYLKIPNSRLFTAWYQDGRLAAYAVEGKGADLQGYVHEWGGDVEALLALANHIHVKKKAPITFIAPQHAQNLIRQMETLGAKRVDGYLGMIKILNHTALFNKVARNLRQEWGIENFVLEKGPDGQFYFGAGEDIFRTDQESDIVKLVFGPQKPSQLFDAGPTLNEALDKALPFELWVWGWDSV